MTNREFYTAVINANINDTLTEFAQNAIFALDKKNEKKRTTVSKAQAANADLKTAILGGMTVGTVYKASDLATAHDVSTQKISALMKQLVDEGKVVSSEVKEKGKGKVKGYALAVTAEDETIE